jgi:Flp pilus assembly pilin Flp
MRKFLSHLWNDESGISSVEYALLLSFVAAGIIIGATELSYAVNSEMTLAAICLKTGSCL